MRKNNMLHRIISVGVSMILAAGMAAMPAAVQGEETLPEPVVALDFQQEAENGFFTGIGAAAQLINDPQLEEVIINGRLTKAVRFQRNGASSKYLRLYDSAGDSSFSRIDGKEGVTVSYWENGADNTNSWPFFCKNNATQAGARNYLGIISKNTLIHVEKQFGKNTYVEVSAPVKTWRHVAVVFQQSGASVYINGEYVNKLNQTTGLTDILGTEPDTYLGLAPWGSGEGSNMYMDEFRMYDSALTEEQIALDYNREIAGEKAPDPAEIVSLEASAGAVSGNTVGLTQSITVKELKEALVLNPEDGEVTVYTDSTLGTVLEDDKTLAGGNVIVAAGDGYRSTVYTIQMIPEPLVNVNFEDEPQNGYFEGKAAMAKMINQPAVEEVVIKDRLTKAIRYERNGAGSRYLQLVDSPDKAYFSVINGKESFTISYWETVLDETTSWSFFTKNKDTEAGARKYVGILTKASSVKTEKNNGKNEGKQVSAPSKGWRHVTIVLDHTGASIYINGQFTGKQDQTASLASVLGQNPDTYLGFAPWGSGEGSNLYMDEFCLYDTALSDDLVAFAYERQIAGEKAPDPAYAAAIDPEVGELGEENILRIQYGTTAAQLKAALTTSPEYSDITIYSDVAKTTVLKDNFVVGADNVLEVSRQGYWKTTYVIAIIPYKVPTMVSETEDTVTISFGPEMLYHSNNNASLERGPSYGTDSVYGNDTVGLGGWGTQATMNLPALKLEQLQTVQVSARMDWYTKGRHWLQMRFFDRTGGYTMPAVAENYEFNSGMSSYSSFKFFDRSAESGFDPDSVDHITLQWYGNQNGNGSCFAGMSIRNINYIYAKTENEKALDEALARAEAVENPGGSLETAIAQARKYKVAMADTYEEIVQALSVGDQEIGEIVDALNEYIPAGVYPQTAIRTLSDDSVGTVDGTDVIVKYGVTVGQLLDVLAYSPADSTGAVYSSYGASLREETPMEASAVLKANMVLRVKCPGCISRNYTIIVKAAPLNEAVISSLENATGYISGNVISLRNEAQGLTGAQFKKQISTFPYNARVVIYDQDTDTVKADKTALAEGDMIAVSAADYLTYRYVIRILQPVAEIQGLDASAGTLEGKGFYLKEGITAGQLKESIAAEDVTLEVYRTVKADAEGNIAGDTPLEDDQLLARNDVLFAVKNGFVTGVYTVVSIAETEAPALYIQTVDSKYAEFLSSGLITEPDVTVSQLIGAITVNTDGADIRVYQSGTLLSDGTLSAKGALMGDTEKIRTGNMIELTREGWVSRGYKILNAKENQYTAPAGSASGGGGGWAPPVTGNVDITKGSDSEGNKNDETDYTQVVKKPAAVKKSITIKVGKRSRVRLKNAESATKITYKSGKKKVVQVSRKGSIRAVSPGKTKIKTVVTIGGKKTVLWVKVTVKK